MKKLGKVSLTGLVLLALISIILSVAAVAIMWLIAFAIFSALSYPAGVLAAFFVCFVISFTYGIGIVTGDDNG